MLERFFKGGPRGGGGRERGLGRAHGVVAKVCVCVWGGCMVDGVSCLCVVGVPARQSLLSKLVLMMWQLHENICACHAELASVAVWNIGCVGRATSRGQHKPSGCDREALHSEQLQPRISWPAQCQPTRTCAD
jgi:hypothetical protein